MSTTGTFCAGVGSQGTEVRPSIGRAGGACRRPTARLVLPLRLRGARRSTDRKVEGRRYPELWVFEGGHDGRTQSHAWCYRRSSPEAPNERVPRLVQDERAVLQPQVPAILGLWRAGNHGLSAMARQLFCISRRHGDLPARPHPGTGERERALSARQLRMGELARPTQEQTGQPLASVERPTNDPSGRGERDWPFYEGASRRTQVRQVTPGYSAARTGRPRYPQHQLLAKLPLSMGAE